MSLAEKIKSSDGKLKPGPRPGMNRLLDALPPKDRKSLEELILNDADFSANLIREILADEAVELAEKAKKMTGVDKDEAQQLIKLLDISAFTIGRFRRQLRAGTVGVA